MVRASSPLASCPKCIADFAQINNLFGQSAFQNRFGEVQPNGSRTIPANWQAGINNASSGGQILGLLLNGWAASRFGSKRVYMAGMVGMTATSEWQRDEFQELIGIQSSFWSLPKIFPCFSLVICESTNDRC